MKASHETHADAGDRSSDAVRVNATELRARVVGEGGNLGLTQAARIEYALAGGLVNTDFIDNSAGVDTSDHEVNIKILLAGAIAAGELRPEERGTLLHALTDEVAAHVLRHNDGQNMALAASRHQAPRLLHVHGRYLRQLLRENRVSLRDRRAAGREGDRGPALGGHRPDHAGARGAARPYQDRGGPAGARLRPAGRPVPAVRARRVLPRTAARSGSPTSSARTGCAGRSSPPR